MSSRKAETSLEDVNLSKLEIELESQWQKNKQTSRQHPTYI